MGGAASTLAKGSPVPKQLHQDLPGQASLEPTVGPRPVPRREIPTAHNHNRPIGTNTAGIPRPQANHEYAPMDEPSFHSLSSSRFIAANIGTGTANSNSYDMVAYTTMSLGMNQEDLLFNMMYFGGINAARLDQVGPGLNSVVEETIAAHSASNTPYKLHPATAEDMSTLNTQVVSDVSAMKCIDCAVCKETFELDAAVITLATCGHVFHEECLVHWLSLQNWCPICRCNVAHVQGEKMEAKKIEFPVAREEFAEEFVRSCVDEAVLRRTSTTR